MKRNFISLNPKIHTSIHIFDHTVKPILLYGSEIWACSIPKKTSVDDLFDFTKIARSFLSEKLHIHFCKYILGVHKRSSNFAVFSELGRYPLQINILLSTLSYWHRHENTNTELLSDAFACSQTLHKNGFHSWFSSINNILSMLGITYANHQLNNLNSNMFKKSIRSILLNKYKEFWSQFRINNIDGKLRTYFTFKDHFQTEQYLSTIKNFDKRRCLAKFRISSHKLKIETGRFTRPLTPLENRVCDHCFTTIEDEFHF